jgi:hypothetical protein
MIRNPLICFVFLMMVQFSVFGQKGKNRTIESKIKLMWFDAEVNFERFSNPHSIDFYLDIIPMLRWKNT